MTSIHSHLTLHEGVTILNDREGSHKISPINTQD